MPSQWIDAAEGRERADGWYPLRLTSTIRPLVFGGRALADRLGRTGLPQWSIAESWELCDTAGSASYVTNGPFSGASVHELIEFHPQHVLGRRGSAPPFPLFVRFVDATGVTPVQIDVSASSRDDGGTSVWHVLDAEPGATMRCGLQKRVDAETLRDAITQQDFDAVLRQVPVRPGNTIGIPAGTFYGFGPATLLYGVAGTPGDQYSVSRWQPDDGADSGYGQWQRNVEAAVRACDHASRPMVHSGTPIVSDEGVHETLLHTDGGFVLERWQVAAGARLARRFVTGLVVTNVGVPVTLHWGTGEEHLEPGRTVLLPAALGAAEIEGPADVLVTYVLAPA